MNTKGTINLAIQWRGSVNMRRGVDSSVWKSRNAIEEQRKLFKKRLFGQHYNYTRVGLNKEKQYLLQQQKNTQIERQNLILLQKIQKISRKMPLQNPVKRLNTQQEAMLEQNAITAITDNAKTNRRRYQRTSQTQDEQVKHSLSSFSVKKSARQSRKHLFKGGIEGGGETFGIKAYLEDDKYVIWISLGKNVQKIKVKRDDYLDVYNNLLGKDHGNICSLLSYNRNGKMFELLSVDSQMEIQKQVKLPAIEHKQKIKHKTEVNLEP